MRFKAGVVGALAMSVALLAAGPASAADKATVVHNYYVTNSLAGAAPDYAAFVDVDSTSSKCVRSRKATLLFKGDEVGTGRTDSEGVIQALSAGFPEFRGGKWQLEIAKKKGCKAAEAEGRLKPTGFTRLS